MQGQDVDINAIGPMVCRRSIGPLVIVGAFSNDWQAEKRSCANVALPKGPCSLHGMSELTQKVREWRQSNDI